jgi:spore coat polysaccharide biosynthesis protein SpsF
MKYIAIIQARMSSSRFPGKVMEEINGVPSIKFQIKRLQKSKVDKIVVATSIDESDDVLVDYLDSQNIRSTRGSLHDVASRFFAIVKEYKVENFLRLTADCPFVMPSLIDDMINTFEQSSFDYLTNTRPPTFPDGLDIEIVRSAAFEELMSYELSELEREHVTLGFHTRADHFSCGNIESRIDLSHLRWTVDYPADLAHIRELASRVAGKEVDFDLSDILRLLEADPELTNTLGSDFRNIALQKSEISERGSDE